MQPGDTFGSLTLLELLTHRKPPAWLCKCACGEMRDYAERTLKAGQVLACCRADSRPAFKHGMSRHPAYLQYHRMVRLCKTYTRVERLKNKTPEEFKNKTYVNKTKKPAARVYRLKKDLDNIPIVRPTKEPYVHVHERLGYVQRPIPISPEVATWELFWAAMGPSWFPNSKLFRVYPQPTVPDAAGDAQSAMCLANLRWIPK